MATAQTDEAVLTARFEKMTNPSDVQAYTSLEGYVGLKKATEMDADALLAELQTAKLVSRAGTGEFIGDQWQAEYDAKGDEKFIVCNANEGEPNSFKDKALIQKDPLAVIEGMTIAACLLKATQGYIYIQGEYPDLIDNLENALKNAREANYLGEGIMGISDFNFDIKVIAGGGGYVCGDINALVPAIEGKVGKPGPKVNPVKGGLYGMPTLVNNVETLANIPAILRLGGDTFLGLGTEKAGGTILVSLAGQFKNPGLYEIKMGTPVHDILNSADFGGGSATGKPFKFLHFGGQAGAIAKPEDVDGLSYTYEDLQSLNLTIGAGVIVAMDESINIVDYLEKVAEFYIDESCGKCLACRVGTVRIKEQLQKLQRKEGIPGDLGYFTHTVDHVASQSICPVGQSVGNAIFSGMKLFPDEFKQGVNWDAKETKEVPW